MSASGELSMEVAMLTASQVREIRWRAFLAGYDTRNALLDGPLEELFERWCAHEDSP